MDAKKRRYAAVKAAKYYMPDYCLETGVLKLVSGDPKSDESPPIYTLGNCGEIKFFFQVKGVKVDIKDLRNTLNSLVYNGDIVCFNMDLAHIGCISIFFNPTFHKPKNYENATQRIVERQK